MLPGPVECWIGGPGNDPENRFRSDAAVGTRLFAYRLHFGILASFRLSFIPR